MESTLKTLKRIVDMNVDGKETNPDDLSKIGYEIQQMGTGEYTDLIRELLREYPQVHQKHGEEQNQTPYGRKFYESHREGSLRSAEIIVPILNELIAPSSVIDVGCGVGTWLSVFARHGCAKILGFDGEWVDPKQVMIPQHCFRAADLKKPLRINDRFDLVLSLEVAEHLESKYAAPFVESLCKLGGPVCFSAAIPFQGGTDHLNEQWPEYWSELFAAHDYQPIDCIRPQIHNNDAVDCWYAQNILLFAHRNQRNERLDRWKSESQGTLSRVHPRMFLSVVLDLMLRKTIMAQRKVH